MFWRRTGKYEVTVGEYWAVMGRDPYERYTRRRHPITGISWYEAVEYCNKRSILAKLSPCYQINGDSVTCDFDLNGYRLPTEAEWEFAARGGNQSKGYIYSGSNRLEDVGWDLEHANFKAQIVGQRDPNELGLYDMSGNASEWCWDWEAYQWRFRNASVDVPRGPPDGGVIHQRITRGGSSCSAFQFCKITSRVPEDPSSTLGGLLGFRVCRTAVE